MEVTAMSRHANRFILATLFALLIAGAAGASEFTYQGKLENNGVGVDAGSARFVFRLYDGETGGNLVGSPQTVYPVEIRGGIFTALVDFGETAFAEERRWLEIEVDVTGGTTFERLAPRQLVTASPVAQYALHGGDSPWLMSGANTYFLTGKVGIGTDSPSYPLAVDATGADRSISAINRDGSGTKIGVYGEAVSSDGRGVQGYAGQTSGAVRGVFGWSRSPNGFGIYGANTASSGNAVGVYGETNSATGFAGYFSGRGYFSGALGIGIANPTTPLDVAGTVKATGLQISTGPQAGYVLTSDANGIGTWQAPSAGGIGGSGTSSYLPKFTGTTTLGNSVVYESTSGNIGIGTAAPSQKLQVMGTIRTNGLQIPVNPTAGYVLTTDAAGNGTWQEPTGSGGGFDLPYTGEITSSTPALSITNHGTTTNSSAVYARIDGSGGSEGNAAGEFVATGTPGHAILAYGDYQSAVHVTYSGTVGPAITCNGSGTGGASITCSKLGGYGVKGWASNTGSSSNSRGGWFGSSSPAGVGVHAEADGDDATALYAETEGANGKSVFALATGLSGVAVHAAANSSAGVGLIASGGWKSAQFYGNVEIYEHGTTNKVIELGKGLDYAEGFDVVDGQDAVAPGTVLVIDPENPGRLACSRHPYDSKVAGIVAGANALGSGVRLGAGQFDHDVALAGRVYCNVVAVDEEIRPGDLLTTSAVPGHAMKVRDADRSRGAILGKAMEPLAKGMKGQILVLVTLQ
jgi:hypothetical protein